LKNDNSNIAIHLTLESCEYIPKQIVYLHQAKNKNKYPDLIMVDGVMYSKTQLSSKVNIVCTEEPTTKKNERILLSAFKREKLGEEIDDRFIKLQKENPTMTKPETYQIIADNSREWLGIELRGRQVEGKHYTYSNNLQKHIRKNTRL
jgi:hypothetical protein